MPNDVKTTLTKPENEATQVDAAKKDSQGKTPFSVIEAYKHVRIHLVTALNESNGNVVTISSANAAEGKSTTAINIAITLSQLNKKILLIDADSRRSTIHQKLKIENGPGLLDIIRDGATLDDVVINYNPYLDILTAGKYYNNPSELYSSDEFDSLIQDASKKYDYVIIDTPPVNIVSDALVIAQKTTGMLLVIRAGFTNNETFKRAVSQARSLNINLLGVIMNGVDTESKKYYKYGKYGKYGYGKYYNKYDRYGY